MRSKKSTVCKIVLDNRLVDLLTQRAITEEPLTPGEEPLSALDIATSALTLVQQYSIPKEECAAELHYTGKPCSESCVCYTHALVNAVLEVLSCGPKSAEAGQFLEQEYLYNGQPPKLLH